MSMGLISGIITGSLIVIFLAVWVWAWSKSNKDAFDKMSKLPLEENNTKEDTAP